MLTGSEALVKGSPGSPTQSSLPAPFVQLDGEPGDARQQRRGEIFAPAVVGALQRDHPPAEVILETIMG